MTWEAAIRPTFALGRYHEMYLGRRSADGHATIAAPTGDMHTVTDGAQVDPNHLWLIPDGALPAIRDAIDEHLGRRYDENLVRELRATLDLERERVDRIITRSLR